MVQGRFTKKYDEKQHLFTVVFGDGVRIQKRYLILKPIFPSGGNNLDDGRSISIVTGLSDGMGTCTTTVPPILLVRRGGGAS